MSLSREQFLQSVLELRPRAAVFDCDGTLWYHDSGEAFMHWETERRLLPPERGAWLLQRYADYKRGLVDEDTMCGEMVAVHDGLRIADLERAAEEFIRARIEPTFFAEMMDVAKELAAQGCDLWAVSSTNEWVVKAGAAKFGIPREHALGVSVVVRDGLATGELVRVPSGHGKAVAIRQCMPQVPECAFGNAIFDLDMLEMVARPWVINPNPDLERIAEERRWPVYKPVVSSQ